MAKKKQLAGKTTKLARLPLTQALVEQSEEAERRSQSAPPAPLAQGKGEPLGAVYLHVIKELSSLLGELQAESGEVRPHQVLLPPLVPKPQQIKQTLRLAQQGLRDLHLLLSHP